MEKEREQFMRIAMAVLKRKFPFKPQRQAYAAKLWVKHVEKNMFNFSVIQGEFL